MLQTAHAELCGQLILQCRFSNFIYLIKNTIDLTLKVLLSGMLQMLDRCKDGCGGGGQRGMVGGLAEGVWVGGEWMSSMRVCGNEG